MQLLLCMPPREKRVRWSARAFHSADRRGAACFAFGCHVLLFSMAKFEDVGFENLGLEAPCFRKPTIPRQY